MTTAAVWTRDVRSEMHQSAQSVAFMRLVPSLSRVDLYIIDSYEFYGRIFISTDGRHPYG